MIVCFCALESEYEALYKRFGCKTSVGIGEECFIAAGGEAYPAVLVGKSRVGKKSAGECARWCLERYPGMQLFVSCGIAGGLDETLTVGDVVFGDRIVDDRADRAEWLRPTARANPQLLRKLKAGAQAIRYNGRPILCREDVIVCSDIGVFDRETGRRLFERYRGACVEMECAGAAAVCRSVGVPMLAVKTISDHADEGALLSMVRSQRQIMVNLADLLAFAFDGES